MLCLVPSSFKNALNVLSMKWDPPSLTTMRGVPKRGKITSWNIFLACLASVALHGIASTHLARYVVDGNKDVFAILGLLEWSQEVNAPHIKYFYLKVVVEGHCIASGDVSLKLALLTPSDELLGVLVHRRLEESTLPDLGLCAEYSVVASVRCRVVFLNDL
jgi:hypothetical protein